MASVSFDLEIIPDEESVAVLFNVPPATDWQAVHRLVLALIAAFAAAERRTLVEMEALMATTMTITRVEAGTEIQMSRPCSDKAYFGRFDAALCSQALTVH